MRIQIDKKNYDIVVKTIGQQEKINLRPLFDMIEYNKKDADKKSIVDAAVTQVQIVLDNYHHYKDNTW